MKKMHWSAIQRGSVSALICGVALLTGCSITVMPKDVPPIKGYETVSLTGVSLIVTNAEKDSTEYEILTDKGSKSGLRTNRQVWSRMLVEALAMELAKRSASVRVGAPLTLSLALPEITFVESRELYQFKVKVVVSSSAGWSKNYEGRAQSGTSTMESGAAMANRLSGRALAEAVKAMLGDAEFLAHMGGKTESGPLVNSPSEPHGPSNGKKKL